MIITINDLMEMNGKYYVGDLVDIDGYNWVDKKMAEQIIFQLNFDWLT
jgi:hypothetical protein